jgi:hypothetical protein
MHALVLTIAMLLAPAATKSDADIEADIRARLARSKIAADGFQIKVSKGTAIWTGKTTVIQHKGAATRMAKSAGAAKVDNRIEISAAAKAKASAAMRKVNRVEPRTEPKADAAKPEPEVFVPPPVRRAVVK